MSMEEDNARDYAAKAAMDELRRAIDTFLASSAAGQARGAAPALQLAGPALRGDADRIVARWN